MLGFPSDNDHPLSIVKWNELSWKNQYNSDIRDSFFFAADIFGHQFGIYNHKIYKFLPESGEIEEHSESMNDWAHKIATDYDFETGWSLARDWQKSNRYILAITERLIPRTPFIMGGEYEVDNLVSMDFEKAMNNYGNMYSQIKHAKVGERFVLRGWLKVKNK